MGANSSPLKEIHHKGEEEGEEEGDGRERRHMCLHCCLMFGRGHDLKRHIRLTHPVESEWRGFTEFVCVHMSGLDI